MKEFNPKTWEEGEEVEREKGDEGADIFVCMRMSVCVVAGKL